MKPIHAIRTSILALGLVLGALASAPAIAASKPVVVLSNAEPVSLDPMFTQSDANVILSIHETLFRLDNDGKIVPAVAESIKMLDPLNWEIKIRPGLVFHNGEPINADAVVFTFDRAKKLFAAGQGDLTFALGALEIRPHGEDRRFDRPPRDDGTGSHHHLAHGQSGAVDPAAQILLGEFAGEGGFRAGGCGRL